MVTRIEDVIGRRVRLLGDHPWGGESAEIVGWTDGIGMRVKLLRRDAMFGHECYVTDPKQFREEKKGIDW